MLEPDPAEARVVLETRHAMIVERLLDAGCAVRVAAELPEREAARLDALRAEVGTSLARLAARAEA